MSASCANYENTVESFLAMESCLELEDLNQGDLTFAGSIAEISTLHLDLQSKSVIPSELEWNVHKTKESVN